MGRPLIELARERFSCRTYLRRPLGEADRARLERSLKGLAPAPFGTPTRLDLIAASAGDERPLEGLGTYGTIRHPGGFIVGVAGPGWRNLEDLGFAMEQAVLEATAIGLGTCWVGGFFRKSRFAERAGLAADETLPAVIALGYCADAAKSGGLFGRFSRRASRLPPERLFFAETFTRPLRPEDAGRLTGALECVRLAPSASNRQPWRILRQGHRWHFFLRRTPHYGRSGLLGKILGEADLQRVDMGIAMCHFELAAREAGVSGTWELADPGLELSDGLTGYISTWREVGPGRD